MAIEVLTDLQRDAAERILAGKTTRVQIARDLGINRNTLYEWMRDPKWLEYFRKLEQMRIDAQTGQLVDLVNQAGEVMEKYLAKVMLTLDEPHSPQGFGSSMPGLGTVSEVFKRLTDLHRTHRNPLPAEKKKKAPPAPERGSEREREREQVKGTLDDLLARRADPETTE